MPSSGFTYTGKNFTAVPRAKGDALKTCPAREDLSAALQAAFKRKTFTLMSATIERNAYDSRT